MPREILQEIYHLLGIDRIITEIVPLLVRSNLQRAEIVRPTAPIHRSIFPQVVIGVGNVPGTAPLRPRDYATEQRKRTAVEDASLAAALVPHSVGYKLENSHSRCGGIWSIVLVITVVVIVAVHAKPDAVRD